MRGTRTTNVLISEPGSRDMEKMPFLPYVWGVLKSHWEHHGSDRSVNWLSPIYRSADAQSLLSAYEGMPVDVLGLSCYTWNWNLQCRIAQEVKARNPNCVVVAGGPHPDYKDPAFFTAHPYIDAIAVKDGEITFTNILQHLLDGGTDLAGVRGLYVPNPGGEHVCTGPAEVPVLFEHSPYLEQSDFYEELMRREGGIWSASLETYRGCPYSCSYCDWGSATMTKLRLVDMERVKAEIDWMGRTGISLLFLTDSNVGILKRDLEIADSICETRAKYGHPHQMSYSNAKNNPDRSIAIAKKLLSAGLMMEYELAVQHTDKEVLKATSRANISADKQIQVVDELMKDGVPVEVQLIVGIPGDTYEKWKGCLAELMERGIHGPYMTFFYQLLPNAPAAEPKFLHDWAVGTVERYSLMDGYHKRGAAKPPEWATKGKYIVETKTYSRADWVRMNVYATVVKALHTAGLTQHVARYLRQTHGVGYLDFYERVVEQFCPSSEAAAPLLARLESHYKAFLSDEDATNFLDVEDLPEFEGRLDPTQWLILGICRDSDRFFDGLKAFLIRQYPLARNLGSVIDYQREIIILPTYDSTRGKTFSTNHDWVHYFSEASSAGTGGLAEPRPVAGGVVEVRDTECRRYGANDRSVALLEWGAATPAGRWVKWIDRLVTGRYSANRNNFHELRFRTDAAIPSWRRVGRALPRLDLLKLHSHAH